MKKIATGLALIIVLFVGMAGGFFGREWLKQDIIQEKTVTQILTEENAITAVVDSVTPSVVSISINQDRQEVDPFRLFFGQLPEIGPIEQDIGSGFIIDASGLVVTNKHVVAGDGEYRVITADDLDLKVEKIYRDPVNDLAILKITPPAVNLKPVKMGDSDNLKVGQIVVAIGTALGEFRSTVTTGVISGLGRGIEAGSSFSGDSEQLDNVIQTDAAINPGNSGGPLLNSAGEVIGVNVAVSRAGQNIGFALPINTIKAAIDNFNQTGQFSRPYFGVRYQQIDQKTALLNQLPQGAYIVEVVSNSPAEQAGIKPGDIITAIDGTKLTTENTLAVIIGQKKIGNEIVVEFYRNDAKQTVKIKLAESS